MAEEKDQMVVIKEEGKDDVANLAPFDPSKKKKKKKVVIQDPAEDLEQLVEKAESLSVSDGLEPTFTRLKKKKKKQLQTDLLDYDKENGEDNIDNPIKEKKEGEGKVLEQQGRLWEGTDRDYMYEELLGRAFNTLSEFNPDLAGDRFRTVMRPPQILREGINNMHRQPDHAMSFLLTELGTTGSLDGLQRLVIKGRFHPNSFQGLLRRYLYEYVICNCCKSPETHFTKENRVLFLKCEKCDSARSVAPIKDGFKALVSRRGNART